MTARILIVDDVAANLKILKARLVAEYFDVVTVSDGRKAIEFCRNEAIDLVLLDVLMPGLNGFEVCRFLKSDPLTMHIPVIMLTALDRRQDRVAGLNAGADDFLTKPARAMQLIARVKSLVRLKTMTDELRSRARNTADEGIEALLKSDADVGIQIGACLLVHEDPSAWERIQTALNGICHVEATANPGRVTELVADRDIELIVIDTQLDGVDPLRLCSQLRSRETTRFTPIILICGEAETGLISKALELGVDDYIVRPIDHDELVARCKTQIKRKRYNDCVRTSVSDSVTFSVTDPLTGLFNRRYLDNHVEKLFTRSRESKTPLSLLLVDIDRFKTINDSYGHDAGDRVLTEFSKRMREIVRASDLLCRIGGEEFVIVLPNTALQEAGSVAERLRFCLGARPYMIGGETGLLEITASIGLSMLREGDTVTELFKRADTALLQAKAAGRNRVKAAA